MTGTGRYVDVHGFACIASEIYGKQASTNCNGVFTHGSSPFLSISFWIYSKKGYVHEKEG